MKNMPNYTKKNWAKRIAALMLATAMLAAFGCSKKSDAAVEGEPEMDIAVPVATPEPKPEQGGEVRTYMPANADITDPLMVNTEEMLSFFSLIYEGLIGISSDGKLTAELAENWASEDGGKSWTVKLRTGVMWHNSQKTLTSRDVTLTFERLKAAGEDCYYSFCTDKIESIEAIDNTSLLVTMKQAGYASLYALTFPIMVNGAPTGMPIGTGPYSITRADGTGIELTANESWWKQRPYIDRFIFVERNSNDTALASYSAGQLDMVSTSSTTAGKYRQENETTVLDVMTQSAEIMLVNRTSPVLNDIRVRQAIACALDRSKIISNIYMNRAQACDVPVAPDSWIYETKSKLYDYNTTNALKLLEEAGWTDANEDGRLERNGMALSVMNLQLLVNDSMDGTRKSAAATIAEQLVELGINVEVITAPYSVSGDNSEYIDMLRNGEYDIALMGLNLGQDGDLTELFAPDGSANYGNYYDDELYSMAQNVTSAADEAAYRDAASAFQLKFAEKLPFIMLYFRLNSIVHTADIKGMTDAREPDIMRSVNKWYIYTTDSWLLSSIAG